MIQLTCPDAARWEALLADGSAPDEAAELEAHLSGCSRCRSLLDELAVGSSGWLRDAGRLAAETSADPALTRTLHRLHDSAVDDHAVPPISLDFLTPSDQPGILGTLGRYQVLAVLGRGAMGIVLKALDPDLLRPVAIKVLAPYLAPSGTARQRFLREARAAAAVSHDHVVKIHGVEPADLPYIVMEYVSGVSLQARLDRDGPLPPSEIARIGLQAAQGLAAAHAVGLIHRDVKPANILLENGVERVKLTDFGLAQAADDARLTQSGVAAGTPLYMSPEQARGEKVDPRSDLFSLGSVLYALATGFPPFRAGSTMGVLNRITNDPPRPIRETIPDFPAALEKIIMPLLEKDPANRFQLATDVAGRLADFLSGPHPEPARPRQRVSRAWFLTLVPAAVIVIALSTILTIRTPKGTLVVEVDDPAIKVALDGEELTITGVGPQEVRLRPGTYELTASKDGKPVKQEVVTITRGGKQVVKVMVEPSTPSVVARSPSTVIDPRSRGNHPATSPMTTAVEPESEIGWEGRQRKQIDEFKALLNRVGKTSAGRVVLTAGPGADLDKLLSGFSIEDTNRARRLRALGDRFSLLVPQAQKELDRWEKAQLDYRNREVRYKAGLVSQDDLEAARLEVSQAERALKTAEDAMAGIIGDMKKLADELDRPAAREPEPDPLEPVFEKLMAEYDALVLRLAPNSVGRVLVVIESEWNEDKLKDRGLDSAGRDKAVKLLKLRGEIREQAFRASEAIGGIYKCKVEIARVTRPEVRENLAGAMRQKQQDLKVRTETIRGLVDDLKKLADVLVPPAPRPDDEPPPPTDPKSQLQSLRDQLKSLDAEAKIAADLTTRIEKEEKELQKMEADLPKVSGSAADDLRRQIDSARKTVVSLKNDLAIWKNRQGMRAGIQKLIDEFQKRVEPKKGGQ